MFAIQVRVMHGQDSVTNWKLASSSGEKFADLRGLRLTGYKTYQVLLKAENAVGLQSDAVSTNFTIETESPKVQGKEFQFLEVSVVSTLKNMLVIILI